MAHISEAGVRKINEICDRYVGEKTPLMMILSDIQNEYGYIPLDVQIIDKLSEILGIKAGQTTADGLFTIAALRRLGFHKVYDTNFAADLTIMEEGTELLGRIRSGGVLPMITSCSPGWINYAEYHYGDRLVECDIEAVWNFSPAHLNVPDNVVVQSENLAVSLTALRMQIKNR